MHEAIWCLAYGLMWWWVLLLMRDGAWRRTSSGSNPTARTNVSINKAQGTRIPCIPHSSK